MKDIKNKQYKLIREKDNLIKYSDKILWLEFDDNGLFKSKHDKPAIGRSLLMSPFNDFYTWQTTLITEILQQDITHIKFKTEKSTYDLFY